MRYTKVNSKYVLRKKHQNTKIGTIIERDWVTTGAVDRFVPGKRPYYRDGNFIFTTTNIATSQKKREYGQWVAEWTYDDVKDISSNINDVEVNQTSNDIRDYAYYGSCVELVRSSIENIIKWFPGGMFPNSYPFTDISDSEYMINNPFGIDIYHENIVATKNINIIRYMSVSYTDYVICEGDDVEAITAYKVGDYVGDLDCPSNNEGQLVITVTLNNVELRGYQWNGEIIFFTDNPNIIIRPNDNVIAGYFHELRGFEKQLLNRATTPLYKNSFLTPIELSSGKMGYAYRDYVWPSRDGQIDITSGDYYNFVNRLTRTAELLDSVWCDNLYERMVHEAIKNYDWTYTREFAEGQEEDYEEGGDRVANTLRLIGAYFDDIKRYIDGIKSSTTVTYDGYNNQPESLLSDAVAASGFEPFSIIPVLDGVSMSDVSLTEEYIEENGLKWYGGYNVANITAAQMDNEFSRRLLINAKRIMRTKGTLQAIDMIMGMFGFGEDDYTLTEEYYITIPKAYDDVRDTFYSINYNKDLVRWDDDDDYSGVPLKNVIIGNDTYVVPFYDRDKDYDGYIYFQSKGGWGSDGEEDTVEYLETQSYLGIVSNVAGLFEINPHSVEVNDIYYVMDISDLIDYDTSLDISSASHMFYITDADYTQSYTGWDNVVNAYANGDADVETKAEYLASLVSVNIGNNPHVGFGYYDNGEEWLEYMKQPFKYSIDNHYVDSDAIEELENNAFEVTQETGDKTVVALDNEVLAKEYYLNSKVFVMTNSEEYDNTYFKQYFMDVILNYVMQVIPSTSIFALKGYRETSTESITHTLSITTTPTEATITINGESYEWGEVYTAMYGTTVTYVIEADGYETYTDSWTATSDDDLTITLTAASMTVDYTNEVIVDGGTYTMTITASDSISSVSLNCEQTWLTFSDSTISCGTEPVYVNYIVAKNTSDANRTATIVITNDITNATYEYNVIQAGISLSVSPTSVSVAAAGESFTITVTCDTDYSVDVSDDWLTLDSNSEGTLSFTADANTSSSSRTATITVSAGDVSATVEVTQAVVEEETVDITFYVYRESDGEELDANDYDKARILLVYYPTSDPSSVSSISVDDSSNVTVSFIVGVEYYYRVEFSNYEAYTNTETFDEEDSYRDIYLGYSSDGFTQNTEVTLDSPFEELELNLTDKTSTSAITYLTIEIYIDDMNDTVALSSSEWKLELT